MTYLVDVNVLSEPTKPAPDAKVVGWLSANEGDFVVDSHGLTVATRNRCDFQHAGVKVFDPFA